jgi:GNAT superfamily N-acetyltransferase
MGIRDALPADATEACEVLRRSIVELCAADHHDDAVLLQRWLANKTPDNVKSWIERPDSTALVAVEAGKILAVGAVSDAGEILMNYESPAARFRGVSRALLAELEAKAASHGNRRATLFSTETAHRFYRSCGYIDAGEPAGKFGMASGYPMVKDFAAAKP